MKSFPKAVCYSLILICLATTPRETCAQVMYKNIHVMFGTSRDIFEPQYLNTIDAGMDFSEKPWGSAGAELNVYKFWGKEYNTIGLGFRPCAQVFFMKRHGFKIFTEIKGGVIYMLPEHTDNNFNLTFVCGFGTDIKLSKQNALRITGDYNHLSNGKKNGAIHNPTWSGVGVYIGWVYDIESW